MCGNAGRLKYHAIPSFTADSLTLAEFNFSSLTVLLKLVPQSLGILSGIPLRLKNLTYAFMKMSVSSPFTSSMCTARVVKHMNKAPHCLILVCFTSIGSNRSTPVFVNGDFMASVRTDGRPLIKGSTFFAFLRLQNEHLLAVLFISDLTLTIHHFFLIIENTYSVPIFPRLCLFLTMSLLMR